MKALRYLCFFPSVNFGLMAAEVFPYALIYSLFYIKQMNLTLVLALTGLAFSALYTLLTADVAGEVIRSFAAYLNPLLIFCALLQIRYSHLEKFKRAALVVFAFFCVLLAMQVSGLFGFLDPVFKALVPRATATTLGFRGVTLLATEPARASVEFIFVYAIVRFLRIPSSLRMFADIAVGMVLIFAFKAATGLGLYLVFLMLFNRKLLLAGLPLGLLYLLSNDDIQSGRAATLVVQLANLGLEGSLNLLINTSGNRLISIISAVNYALSHPFGGGIGNWQETSVAALKMTGIDYSQLTYFNAEWKEGKLYFRATGYMMNLLMDVGLAGSAIVAIAIYQLARPHLQSNPDGWKLFLLFVVNIMVVGSVGVPVAWIATAIFIRVMRSENTSKEVMSHAK